MTSDTEYREAAAARGLNEGVLDELRRSRGLSLDALRAIPERSLRRAVRKLDYPNLARAREAFRLSQERDEAGVVPPEALANALRQLDSTRTRQAVPSVVAGVPTGRDVPPPALVPGRAGLGAGTGLWRALGPGNVGGRTRSIVIHPTKPRRMWAGSVGGGVWHTRDGGASWEPVDDFMANLAVSCLVRDPTDPDILYAGTGEGFFNADALRGAGIFRTVDGVHWEQMPSTTGAAFQHVNRIAISANGTVILAATPSGILRSADPTRQVWNQTLGEGIGCVAFHPTDDGRAVAGGLHNGQAYHSTDGGQTWTVATHRQPWSGRVELTYAAKDPARVYASIDLASGEIWRSTNGGRGYTRRASLAGGLPAQYLGEQGWYDNVIWAGDPTDDEIVIVGGIDLWRSTDGGDSLQEISTWWDPRSVHADQHCIVSHPRYNGTTNRTVFFGNDGGVFKATNVHTVGGGGGAPHITGWTELVNTYGVTQFYAGAGHSGTGTIIGGAQDNGTLRYTVAGGSENWTEMFGGDGGWCAADQNDEQTFYGEYVFANVHRSNDGGESSEFISGQFWSQADRAWRWKPVPFRIGDARTQNALFIAPFALDPNESDRLLVGGVSLWRTTDAKTANTDTTGPSWRAIKAPAQMPISALAIARGESRLVWVGHADGQVYKSVNARTANPTWQQMDHTGHEPVSVDRYLTGITIDAKDHDTVYLTFGGYTKGNVWKTTNGGATWANVGQAFPAAPVRALTLHPDNSALVYAGTEVGLFVSEDGAVTWSPTNEGPTNCSVDDLFWMGRTLVCVTHGRGMFAIDLTSV